MIVIRIRSYNATSHSVFKVELHHKTTRKTRNNLPIPYIHSPIPVYNHHPIKKHLAPLLHHALPSASNPNMVQLSAFKGTEAKTTMEAAKL